MTLIFVFAPYSTMRERTLADLEQYAVTPPSSLFDGVTVESVSLPEPDKTFVGLFTVPPPLLRNAPRWEHQPLLVQKNDFVYFAFNLMPGSSIDVSWDIGSGVVNSVDFYVFQGESTFKGWQDPDETGYLAKRPYYNAVGFGGTYHYDFTKSDDVFFVWENGRNPQIQGTANFTVNAFEYDWKNTVPEVTCRLYPCFVDLTGDKLLLFVARDTMQLNNMRKVIYRIHGRVGLYFGVVFGIVGGLVLCLVLACLIAKFKSRRNAYTVVGVTPSFNVTPQAPIYSPTAVTPLTPGAPYVVAPLEPAVTVTPPLPPAVSPEFDDGPTPSAPPQ